MQFNPQVRFSSKIQFVPRQFFDDTPAFKIADAYVDEISFRNVAKAKSCWTKGILICNAGGVQDSQQLVMFHFHPWISPQVLLDKLKTQVNSLNSKPGQLRALLIGGESKDSASVRLRDTLKEFYRSRNIPFSTLWGQKDSGKTAVKYSVNDDTWQVSTITNHQLQGIGSLSDLSNTFEEIDIDPGDELYIGDRKYTPEEIKTAETNA